MRFLGWQDTLLIYSGRQYFENCYHQWTLTLLRRFPTAYFKIATSLPRQKATSPLPPRRKTIRMATSSITAKITGAGPSLTYLGRPWRPYGK